MTNGKNCACLWNEEGEVEIFCGAHMKKHQEMIQPLIEDKSRLEYIKSYANGMERYKMVCGVEST